MLCEKCQKNPATIKMQQFINGAKKEINMCQNCANTFGIPISLDGINNLEIPISLEHLFQGFMQQFSAKNFTPTAEANVNTAKPTTPSPCRRCGMTFDEFSKGTKLGCDACYQAFNMSINSLLKNVQGSTKHIGKVPQRGGASLLQRRTVDKLRTQLKQAVIAENFEEAARLRDEIRNIESANAPQSEVPFP